ncbi:MAG: leucine-rich repeat domain-containing protein [Deltaproteobacteria bacterium]|nr:leucine-rich repeat domain-containing protein [Deltaproteobacteria bacterium]
MKLNAFLGLVLLAWPAIALPDEPCSSMIKGKSVGICQVPVPFVADNQDPIRKRTVATTKVTAWRLPVVPGQTPLWSKEIPSGPGEVFVPHQLFEGFVGFFKPVTSAFPSKRFYDVSNGAFVLATTVKPAAKISYPEKKLDLLIPRLVGIEVWASFIQPIERTGIDERNPDILVDRITYASPKGPIAVLGLRCKSKHDVTDLAFDPLRPGLSLVAEGGLPEKLIKGRPPAFTIVVTFFSKMLYEKTVVKGVLRIPVDNDAVDVDHAQLPADCRLVRLDAASNGEDVVYNDAADRELLVQAATLKKLHIVPGLNDTMLSKLERFTALESLSLSGFKDMKALPEAIGKLTELRELIVDNGNGCSMTAELPESIGNLIKLKKLVLNGALAQTPKIPKGLSGLKGLEELNIGRNGFDEVPDFVRELTGLRELDLSFNRMTDLPQYLQKFPGLKKIGLSENRGITDSAAKQAELKKKFPAVEFDFTNEYD